MKRTRIFAATVATVLIGAGALSSSVASASNNVGWSVSIGAPGFAVTAGQPAFGPGYATPAYYGAPFRPYFRPHLRRVVVAPPIVYNPWYAPVVSAVPFPAYAPRAAFYAPPVVVAPRRLVAAPVRFAWPPNPY